MLDLSQHSSPQAGGLQRPIKPPDLYHGPVSAATPERGRTLRIATALAGTAVCLALAATAAHADTASPAPAPSPTPVPITLHGVFSATEAYTSGVNAIGSFDTPTGAESTSRFNVSNAF